MFLKTKGKNQKGYTNVRSGYNRAEADCCY